MQSLLIKDAFDTARLVAFYRAVASERSDACFRDPYARLLAGKRGEKIGEAMPGKNLRLWGIILRTCVYDEIILRIIDQEKIDTIINLAAGLDTRPYRLPLPASLHWIEVDRPQVLAYKEKKLANERPVCVLERVPLDMTDREAYMAFLTKVNKEAGQILVLTEGLLIYLAADHVAAIAQSLHEQENIRWWLTEFSTPLALMKEAKLWNARAEKTVRMRFVPPGGITFFQLCGWHVADLRSPIPEALRLKLPIPNGWAWQVLSRILPRQAEEIYRNTGGLVLFKREKKEN
jgi:methyltransferase (TIGR00027 family)